MEIAPEQSRAARAWLKMSQVRLARAARVGVWTVMDFELATLHLLQILEDLPRRNITFQSIMDGFATNTAAGRMVFSMVSAMAEFERSVISERR
jgi:DNA invertase Pin-like site-specific DNA recombinase